MIKWWVAFARGMDIPFYWRWAFPHTQALTVDCESHQTEPHVIYRVKGWGLGTEK